MLSQTKYSIPGLHWPYAYESGPKFGASFSDHEEHYGLYSLSHLHVGRKLWKVIPPSAADAFIEKLKETDKAIVWDCEQCVRHAAVFVPPSTLTEWGIPFTIVDRRASEVVVTMPRAYHSGFSTGYTLAEAVHYADAEWSPHGHVACLDPCPDNPIPIDLLAFLGPEEAQRRVEDLERGEETRRQRARKRRMADAAEQSESRGGNEESGEDEEGNTSQSLGDELAIRNKETWGTSPACMPILSPEPALGNQPWDSPSGIQCCLALEKYLGTAPPTSDSSDPTSLRARYLARLLETRISASQLGIFAGKGTTGQPDPTATELIFLQPDPTDKVSACAADSHQCFLLDLQKSSGQGEELTLALGDGDPSMEVKARILQMVMQCSLPPIGVTDGYDDKRGTVEGMVAKLGNIRRKAQMCTFEERITLILLAQKHQDLVADARARMLRERSIRRRQFNSEEVPEPKKRIAATTTALENLAKQQTLMEIGELKASVEEGTEPLEIETEIEVGTSGEPRYQRGAKALAGSSSFVSKAIAIEHIWRGHYGNDFTITRELEFRFAHRCVAHLECHAYSLIPPPDEDFDPPPPNHVAWLDLDEIAELRQRHRNPPCPKDPLRDPYMVAVLIALAQSQRFESSKWQQQWRQQQRKDENGIYWRVVLMVTDNGHEWLHIYGASISAEFLNRFDAPTYSPPPTGGINAAGMTIEYWRLRLRPYSGDLLL
ncbi:hypothetical protein OQA88_2511 [Cercophora sp. LCS_1]